MTIWSRNKSASDEALSGKELSAWIKERKQENAKKFGFMDTTFKKNYYLIGFWTTSVIAFIVCWIYAIASWGFLLGVGLGWIPSLFISLIAGFIWPLLALLIIIGLFIIAAFLIYMWW
jgi:hypothetical protein